MSTDLHDLLVPYALDSLDAHERTRFETHLDSCDVCHSELAGFQETTVRLADAVAASPPSALRAEILASAQETPQERAVVTAISQRSRVRRALPRLVVAAAFLAALAGLGGYVVEHQRADELRTESDRMTAVMAADDAAFVSAPVAGGGELRVMHSAAHGDAVVIGSDLTTLDDDEVYQVWAMYDGHPQSVGLLGHRSGALFAPETAGAEMFAVTIEPAGGSEQPTSDPIAATEV